MNIQLLIADGIHMPFAKAICELIEASAKIRGTGIARRDVKYIEQKITSGHAIVALKDKQLVGFCYIETWSHGTYVSNSGLVVDPNFRQLGIARMIKEKAFNLARNKYPNAKIFGITTSAAVMKINSELGYRAVSLPELTQDDAFWNGCQSCPNYYILQTTNRKMCLCTGMLAMSKTEELQNINKLQNNEKTK